MRFRIKALDVGPIVGDASNSTVRLWGRAEPIKAEDGIRRCFGIARLLQAGKQVGKIQYFKMTPDFDMTGVTVFKGLAAATEYEYQIGCLVVDLDFKDLEGHHEYDWTEAHRSSFKTAADGPTDTRSFVFGSCRYFLKVFGGLFWETKGDRTFRSVLEQIDDGRQVDFTLMLGDQIYADDLNFVLPDSKVDQFFERYRQAFSQPHMRRLMSRVPTYMTLDDHEIENDWPQWETGKDRKTKFLAAIRAFKSYQLNHCPLYDVRSDGRIDGSPEDYWYTFQNGCCDVFVTDSRTERVYPTDASKRIILSEEQITELKTWLLREADGRVKLVATSVPFFPDLDGGEDRWDGFPEQRNEILDWIQKKRIQKVVFLSGDVHASMSAELVDAEDQGFKIVSIVSSPFYWPGPHPKASRFQLSGDLKHSNGRFQICNASRVVSKDNFTRVTVKPERVQVEVFGRKGIPQGTTTFTL